MVPEDETSKLRVMADPPADDTALMESCAPPLARSGDDILFKEHTQKLIHRMDDRLGPQSRLMGANKRLAGTVIHAYPDDLLLLSFGGPCLVKKPKTGS